MKRTISRRAIFPVSAAVIILLLTLPIAVHAASDTAPNRNYFKLCILNENNEVLLVEHNTNWELIGGEYNDTSTLEEYVRKLAMSSNVEVSDIRLRGLFSVYFNSTGKPLVYHYYSARYVSGKIQPPGDCTGVQWADLSKAKKIMAYEEMLWMYEHMLKSDRLLGGAYRIIKDREKGTRKVEIIDDYFELN